MILSWEDIDWVRLKSIINFHDYHDAKRQVLVHNKPKLHESLIKYCELVMTHQFPFKFQQNEQEMTVIHEAESLNYTKVVLVK